MDGTVRLHHGKRGSLLVLRGELEDGVAFLGHLSPTRGSFVQPCTQSPYLGPRWMQDRGSNPESSRHERDVFPLHHPAKVEALVLSQEPVIYLLTVVSFKSLEDPIPDIPCYD